MPALLGWLFSRSPPSELRASFEVSGIVAQIPLLLILLSILSGDFLHESGVEYQAEGDGEEEQIAVEDVDADDQQQREAVEEGDENRNADAEDEDEEERRKRTRGEEDLARTRSFSRVPLR